MLLLSNFATSQQVVQSHNFQQHDNETSVIKNFLKDINWRGLLHIHEQV